MWNWENITYIVALAWGFKAYKEHSVTVFYMANKLLKSYRGSKSVKQLNIRVDITANC